MRTVLVLVGLMTVAGCAQSPTVADFKADCLAYGFKDGTDALAACVQREHDAYLDRLAAGAAVTAAPARPPSCHHTGATITCF